MSINLHLPILLSILKKWLSNIFKIGHFVLQIKKLQSQILNSIYLSVLDIYPMVPNKHGVLINIKLEKNRWKSLHVYLYGITFCYAMLNKREFVKKYKRETRLFGTSEYLFCILLSKTSFQLHLGRSCRVGFKSNMCVNC